MKELLSQTYSQDSFEKIVSNLLPDYEKNETREESLQGFDSVKQLGISKSLDLVVFTISTGKNILARVDITKRAYAILKNHTYSHALIAFHDKNLDEWRISLLTTKVIRAKSGIKESVSNPRRFSYVLGPNAKVVTPSKMLQGITASISDLENKFSLAVVSKEFFTKIATQYSKLVGGTRGEGRKAVVYERTLKLGNTDDAVNANFAIRLIGRLVFCWFLKQKSGHLNNPLIPPELLSVSAVKTTGDYYHSVCVPLFFEVLNKPQPSRPTFFSYAEWFDKVPFLNGGLFQDHEEDNHKFNRTNGMSERRGVVNIPDVWFSELFQIFEEYNFTIDENTSIDTELSIDPEILGRIFENLLAEVNPETGASARKSTGSFYTPREIVDFMVEESLVEHLKMKTGIQEEQLRSLSSYNLEDDISNPINQQERKILVEAIHNMTILDPACGSGAFPIGVLQRLVHMLGVLDPECLIYLSNIPPEMRRQLQKHSLIYIRKLGVIRECIHGVDIQPIAIDISRLRCFLTLIVDQKVDDNEPNRGIEPLPNLDFKFVCANTLIKPPIHEGPLFGDEFADALGELIDEYFAPVDQNHKLVTAGKLKDLIHEKTKKELDNIINSFSYVKEEKYKQELAKQNEKSISTRRHINDLWGSYENIFQNKPVGFFDTRYFFPAVFRNGGFDIVIGNPPYVGEKGHKELFRDIKNSPIGKKFYLGKMDLFYFFFHVGLDNLHDNGILAYITTNYYPTAPGGRKLREDLKFRSIIRKIVNFNNLKIFKSAAGQHNMITILAKGQDNEAIAKTCITKHTGEANTYTLESITSWQDKQTDYFNVKQNDLFDGVNYDIRTVGTSTENHNPIQTTLNKLKTNGELLGSICNVNQGIVTGADKVSKKHIEKFKVRAHIGDSIFVLSNIDIENLNLQQNEKQLLKPWFKNSDIYKWCTKNQQSASVIYSNEETVKNIEDYPNLFTHLSKFESIISQYAYRWFDLHRSRQKHIFESEKIVAPQRSIRNTFGYNEISWYASADVYFITTKDKSISLKYLLALLNSKLYYLWLYYRGKRKGEILELYQQPLSEIPIKKISELEQKPFIEVVDKILAITKSGDYLENPAKKEEVKEYEKQIDYLVYKLYGLTPEEIEIVENSSKK